MSLLTQENPFKRYVQNGRGIGLKVVVLLSLLISFLMCIGGVFIIKSLFQEQSNTFIETLPTIEFKNGKIIAPIYDNEIWDISDMDETAPDNFRIIANTAVDDVDSIPEKTDIYITAKKLYFANRFTKRVIPFPADWNGIVTHNTIQSVINTMLWICFITLALIFFIVSTLFFLLALLPVMLLGLVINRSLPTDAWCRAFAWPWTVMWNLSLVGVVSGLFYIPLKYIFIISMLLAWILGASITSKNTIAPSEDIKLPS